MRRERPRPAGRPSFRAVARRLLADGRAAKLGFVTGLFLLLAGGMVALPLRATDVQDELEDRPEALAPHIDPASTGVLMSPHGLAIKSGAPFKLKLAFEKISGQSGRIRIHNARMPGLTTALTLRDGDRPYLPAIQSTDIFRDFDEPISLDPMRDARHVTVEYNAQYSSPGMAIVLNRLQFKLDWFDLLWRYFAIGCAAGALTLLLSRLLRPAPLFELAWPLVAVVQYFWWAEGWSRLVFIILTLLAILAAAWLLRPARQRAGKP